MKINGNEIRPGNVIKHKDSIWIAVKISHVKPGKGGAFAQVELKKATDGTKLNERFRSSETIERLRLDSKKYQFLYLDDNSAHFMDQENYEQIQISLNLLEDKKSFLQEGIELEIESYEEEPINIIFPENITLEIIDTEPTVKGQTAASSNKPAELENGLRVMVPPFIQVGEKVVINTNDLSYVKRSD
jgi:elongation factor P